MRTSRETDRYLFGADAVRDWLRVEGRKLIVDHKTRVEGQRVLPLSRPKVVRIVPKDEAPGAA
jgi:hypothetical protein